MAKLKLIETIQTKLSTLTKSDGQLIVVRDNASLYIDLDGNRVYISDWIDVETDTDRLAMLSPLSNKYYYVIETNKIWRYVSGSWVSITKDNCAESNITIAGIDMKDDITSEELIVALGVNTKVEQVDLDLHISNKSNPHEITKSQVGLSNVDNTSDMNKPISTATQIELNKKTNQTDFDILAESVAYLSDESDVTASIGTVLTTQNIVDDVDTSSSSMVLSAKQGKMLNERITNVLTNNGTIEASTEVLDIRVDTDGTTHASAGDAVRSQINKLSNEIEDISYHSLNVYSNVDMWEQGAIPNYENNARIRMNTSISSDVRKVKAKDGYLIGLYAYDIVDGRPTNPWLCWTGSEFSTVNLLYTNEIDMDYFRENYNYAYYKLVSKKVDDSNYLVSEAENILFVTRFNSLDLLNNLPNLKCQFPIYLVNTYVNENGDVLDEPFSSRVCDANVLRIMNNDIIVKVSGDYAIRTVNKYDLNSLDHIGQILSGVNHKEYVLPKGYAYRITYCCNSDPTKDISREELYPNISMYNYTNIEKSFDTLKSEFDFESAKKIFNHFALSGKHFNVKMIGDSILQGVNGTGFAQDGEQIVSGWNRNDNGYCWGNLFKSLLESKYDCTVVNNGCRGTWTGWAIENWNSLVSSSDDLLICCYGTNDRAYTQNQTDFLNNLITIKSLADKWGIKVIFVSGIPAGLQNELCNTNNYDNVYYHMEDIDRLISKATNGNYVSLYNKVQEWLNYSDKELTDYLDEYELHPTDDLYYKMFVWVCESLGIAPKIENAKQSEHIDDIQGFNLSQIITRSFECEIPMEIGGIDGYGSNYDTATRGRSLYKHCVHPLFTLHVPSKYKYRLALYYGYDDGSEPLYTYTDWFSGNIELKDIIKDYQLENGQLFTFRILLGNQYDSELSVIDTISMKTPLKEKDAPYIKSDLLTEVTKDYACGEIPFAAEGYYLSPPIKVKPNTTYESYAIRNYALYNSKYQYIQNFSGGGGTTITTPDNEDIAYLVYCWRNTDKNANNMAFAEKGKLIGGYLFDGEVKKDYYKWIAMGDSITAGYYSTAPNTQGVNSEKSWTKYVADKNGYDLTNVAIGGSGYLDSEHATDNTNAKMKAESTDFSNVDIVTLAYGINDWKYGFAIGSVDDDKNAGNTMASNMKYVIEKILSDNPYIKIFVITPINCMGYDFNYGDFSTNYGLGYTMSENGKTLEEVYEVQKVICEYYGIQMIDNTHNSVVNRVNIASMLLDGVHPTIKCHEVMGRELAKKITY